MMNEISKEKLIITEGSDDLKFIELILNYLNITEIQIEEVGGKPNFKYGIPDIIRSTGFEKVRILAIFRDADENFSSAFVSIKNILSRIEDYDLILPSEPNSFSNGTPRIGIFIFNKPGEENGMLEDICLETVIDHPIMGCVEDFMNCVSENFVPPRNISKAKCLSFLAALSITYPKLSVAIEKKIWNLDSEVLNDLKSFLELFRS